MSLRRVRSITKHFTGAQLLEASMNATAICFSAFEQTRGVTPLAPQRRRMARAIRQFREINHKLCK